MPSPGCPDLLVGQGASLCHYFVRHQRAARPLGCCWPDTGSAEDTGMNGLDRSIWTSKPSIATSISSAFYLTSLLLLLFSPGGAGFFPPHQKKQTIQTQLSGAYGKVSSCLLGWTVGRRGQTPSLVQALAVIAGVGDISAVAAFWWLCSVEIAATPCALSNLPTVTKESVCLSVLPPPRVSVSS